MKTTHALTYGIEIALILLGNIVLGVLASGCAKTKNPEEIVQYDTTDLRNGDLLFRNGCGYESRVVTDLSSGNYSHIGLAYRAASGWSVIHAVPGEAAKGESEYLKCDPIADFYRADRAKAGAWARIECSDSVAELATQHALQLVSRKVVFDNDYDLDDTSELYCTELIRLVYEGCGIDLCEDRYHRTPIIASSRVIYPEDIWASPLLTRKKKF